MTNHQSVVSKSLPSTHSICSVCTSLALPSGGIPPAPAGVIVDKVCHLPCGRAAPYLPVRRNACIQRIRVRRYHSSETSGHVSRAHSLPRPVAPALVYWGGTAYLAVHSLAVAMAACSSSFQLLATSAARGSSGLGAPRRAWMESRMVRICRAGDQLSATISGTFHRRCHTFSCLR